MAIRAVRSGVRQVSAGYNAHFEPVARGEGRQVDLIGNHVALVELARCGPRCSIGDCLTLRGFEMKARDDGTTIIDGIMAKLRGVLSKTLPASQVDLLTKAFADDFGGASSMETPPADISPNGVTMHNHFGSQGDTVTRDEFTAFGKKNDDEHKEFRDAIEGIVAKMGEAPAAKKDDEKKDDKDEASEKELAEEAPEGEEENAKKARDSIFLVDAFAATVSGAEILSPGIDIPVFVRDAEPKKTFSALCGLRRKALDTAYASVEGKASIDEITGKKTLKVADLSCAAVRHIFRGAVAARRIANNARGASGASATKAVADALAAGGAGGGRPKIESPAEFNARMKAKYAAKK
jgi:hypothetical protein